MKKGKFSQAQVVRKESVAGRRSEKGQGTGRKSEKGEISQGGGVKEGQIHRYKEGELRDLQGGVKKRYM